MKTINYLILILLLPLTAVSQSSSMNIGNFDRLVVSPHINVVLIKGEETSVRIESSNVDEDKIIVDTEHDVLNIYLDGARYHNKYEKRDRYDKRHSSKWKEDIYKGAIVTAYVTFDYLKSIQVRGEQQVRCNNIINQSSFKMVFYGEVQATFKEIKVSDLKLAMYGENDVSIESGKVGRQVIKCYGENDLNLGELATRDIKSSLYGENKLNLRADGEIKVTAFGESDIRFSGDAYINKGIIIGETDIRRISR